MAKAPKKTLYHSELNKLGPVEVEIKSDVMQSQYRGHNDYVILELDGYDRNYECENAECVKALDGLKGQTVIIEALNSKDDAEIIVSESTGGNGGRSDDRRAPQDDRRSDRRDDRRNEPRREERSDRRQERREEAPAREEHRQESQTQQRQPANKRPQPTAEDVAKAEAWAIHHFKQGLGKFINAEIMIHQAAVIARNEIKERTGYEVTEAGFQAMTSSAWIFLKDTGKTISLPSKLIPKAGAAPKPTQAPSKQRDDARQPDGNAEAPQPGPHEPPPDDDVPF